MENKPCCEKGCCCRSSSCWLKLGTIVIVAFAAGFAVRGCCKCKSGGKEHGLHAPVTEKSQVKKAAAPKQSTEKAIR